MNSKVVQGAAAALMLSLTLAALAWGIEKLALTVAIVDSMLGRTSLSTPWALIVSAIIVAVLVGGGLFLLNRRLKANQEA